MFMLMFGTGFRINTFFLPVLQLCGDGWLKDCGTKKGLSINLFISFVAGCVFGCKILCASDVKTLRLCYCPMCGSCVPSKDLSPGIMRQIQDACMQSLTTGTTAPPSWIHAWLPDTSSCRSSIICNREGTNYFSSHSQSHTTGTVATAVWWMHFLHDFDARWIDGRHFQLLLVLEGSVFGIFDLFFELEHCR